MAIGKAFNSKSAKQIDAASIERVADVESRPVYLSTVVMVDPNGLKRTIKIVHSPKSTLLESAWVTAASTCANIPSSCMIKGATW